jgi:hypothetical protein
VKVVTSGIEQASLMFKHIEDAEFRASEHCSVEIEVEKTAFSSEINGH